MLYIYILELDENKYYIGKTTNANFGLETHFNVGGSAWTIKYKPIKLIELIAGCDNFDEDKYTLKYMEKFGIENVRGGSFCHIKLSQENINTINKMITSSNKSIDNDINKSKYDDYLGKFNNMQKVNNEIIELEFQFEYVKKINDIFIDICNKWTNTFEKLNEGISKLSCINNKNIRKHDLIREFSKSFGYHFSSIFDDKNDNEIDNIYMELCFFFANKNHERLLKNICYYEKNNKVYDIIIEIFLNTIGSMETEISDLKLKFADACINYDVFEKLKNFNLNVRINKILLLKLQLEKELVRVYKIHQVENFSLYELEINKKIELLTSKMIEFTIKL